jgi:ubiquinone/menaquinone biosynthesis C-methylase UbiE
MEEIKLNYLIHKIFKFLSHGHKNLIKQLIFNCQDLTKQNVLENISNLVLTNIKKNKTKKNNSRQEFIVLKIANFINNHYSNLKADSNLKIVDIGGGNGDVLHKFNNIYKLHKENLVCVETETNWVEKYSFNHSNISYVFWNHINLELPSENYDIILCMVSLHHMTDEIISNTLSEANRILKQGGLLMIKEHNINKNNHMDKNIVEWEHYLYHILDCAYNKTTIDIENYNSKNILNVKSCDDWKEKIEKYNFHLKKRTNRFLDNIYDPNELNNPSNLYWDIYEKL